MGQDTDSKAGDANVHFCIFIHGLWGNPGHLNNVVTSLQKRFADSNVHVLTAKSNVGNYTYDGIELGSERIAREIEDELAQLEKQEKKVSKISVVGYSLGGLIARYIIGLLYSKGYFDRFEPVNFTTFATPHLGTRTPLLGWNNELFNNLGSRTLSMSGQQLWTTDTFRDTGRPILAILADPNSIFIGALKLFKHRSLYSNVVNDRAVPFYTSCIEDFDPFVDPDSLDINYVPNLEKVILQHPHGDEPYNKPVAHKRTTPLTYSESFANGARNAWNKAPLVFFLCTLAPIGITAFFVNSGIQSFRSTQRIQDHAAGKSGIDNQKYKFQLMVQGAQKRAELIMEDLATRESKDYLSSEEARKVKKEASLENGHPVPPQTTPAADNADKEANTEQQNHKLPPQLIDDKVADDDHHLAYGSAYTSRDASPWRSVAKSPHMSDSTSGVEEGKEFPTLALTPEQFAMKKSLDSVGFKKYPVYIHRVNHSHAAIIVRSARPGFGEGRVVIKHWTDRFEI